MVNFHGHLHIYRRSVVVVDGMEVGHENVVWLRFEVKLGVDGRKWWDYFIVLRREGCRDFGVESWMKRRKVGNGMEYSILIESDEKSIFSKGLHSLKNSIAAWTFHAASMRINIENTFFFLQTSFWARPGLRIEICSRMLYTFVLTICWNFLRVYLWAPPEVILPYFIHPSTELWAYIIRNFYKFLAILAFFNSNLIHIESVEYVTFLLFLKIYFY